MAYVHTYDEFWEKLNISVNHDSIYILRGIGVALVENWESLFGGECNVQFVPQVLEQATNCFLGKLCWDYDKQPAEMRLLLKGYGSVLIDCLLRDDSDKHKTMLALDEHMKSLLCNAKREKRLFEVTG